MTAKQIKEAKRALRMQTFAKARLADFQHTPAHPGDAKYTETIAKMDEAIEELGGKEAIQQADEYGQKTEEQRADRGDCETMLRKINTAVAAISEDTKNPGLMDRFRMPHGDGDTELAAKLRSFGAAITELHLEAALLAHFLAINEAQLEQMAVDLLSGAGEQGGARGKRAGATATIPDSLKTLRSCRKTFDAIYGNVYEANGQLLAEWRSVSHVERDPKKSDDGTEPNGATPPTP